MVITSSSDSQAQPAYEGRAGELVCRLGKKVLRGITLALLSGKVFDVRGVIAMTFAAFVRGRGEKFDGLRVTRELVGLSV